MQLILDNLISTAIVGTLGLLIVGVTLGRAEADRDAVRFYAHQQAQVPFTNMVEQDLTDAGMMTPDGERPVQSITAASVSFYGRSNGVSAIIEYRRVSAGVADGVPVFRVERRVDGALAGSSSDAVSRFDVRPLAADGTPTAVPEDVRMIAVDMEWTLPLVEAGGAAARQAVRRSAWSTVIRPIGLDR